MPFDLSTAKPIQGFDLSTAKPIAPQISDEELAQFRAQGFNGTKEELAQQKAQFEATKGQHSAVLQAARDVPIGAITAPAFLADAASLPHQAINKGIQYVMGREQPPWFPASAMVNKLDQAIASPANTPQTGPQRIVRDLTRAGAGAAATMGLGAAIGGPTSILAANPGMQMLSSQTGALASGLTREAGGGKGAQIIAGILGSLAPGTARYAAERIIGEPSQAAKVLQAKGVDNLTPGQQQAGGAYSQIEDASTHLPLIGSQFQKAKDAAQQSAKEAFILEGAAPGAKVQPTGDLKQTLSNVGDTFGPVYDAVSGFPLKLSKGQPVIVNQGANTPLSTAFNKVVANKGILATDETRKSAADFLSNLLTLPVKNSEDLIAMRSAIRTETASLAGDQSLAARGLAKILDGAEQQVTNTLESQLPPNLMNNLKAVDAQYAKYKVAVDAMAKAKDRPTGFTWNEASQAAKTSAQSALGKDAYAKGQGFMRDIPAAATEAFATRPPTGASLTAQGAAYPLLPATAFMSLTNTGRALAARNKLNPMNYSPAAQNALLGSQLDESK